VNFAREGFTYIAIAALVAAGMYAAALNRRSWALWLVAFALTIGALGVAYFFRDPHRPGTSAERVVSYTSDAARAPREQRMEIIRTRPR
jgi:hypothetical protein